MFYKYIKENSIKPCSQNGVLKDGRAISNLPLFLEQNPELAEENGYYPLVSSEKPIYDENKYYLKNRYSLNNNVITKEYEIIENPVLEKENAFQEG